MNSNKQIKLGAFASYFAIIFNILAGLIYTPWMVRQIGQADYGLFTLVTSVISYFTLDFGFGGAISKFIAQYRAENKEEEISNLLGLVYKFYFVLDFIILVILLVVYFLIENIFVSLTPDEIVKFKNIFLIVGLFTLVSFPCSTFNGIMIAYERFVALKVCDLLNKVLIVVIMVIALAMGCGLYTLVIVNMLVHFCINIAKYISVKKAVRRKINFRFYSKKMLKMFFSFSIWVTVISIAQRFIMNITPSVLGITAGAVAISIFSVGRTIEGYTYTFANALNSLFLPKVSRMVAQNVSRDEIENLMIKVGRIQLIIIGAIILIFLSMGQEFVVLWMGENFKESYVVTLLLILPSIVTLTQDIGHTLLVVENEMKYRAIFYIAAAIISVVLSFTLSGVFGAIGAAIGIFIATVVGHIIGMNWVFQKKMKLDMKKFYLNCHVRALPCFAVILVSGFLIQKFWIAENLFWFAVKVCIIGLEYIVIMWAFYMNKYEKQMIKNMLKKICLRK